MDVSEFIDPSDHGFSYDESSTLLIPTLSILLLVSHQKYQCLLTFQNWLHETEGFFRKVRDFYWCSS